MNFELQIDRLLIETNAAGEELSDASKTVQEAMQLLGRMIEKSPFARRPDVLTKAVDELRVSSLSAEELLGARGAERLAELLYQELSRMPAGSLTR